jgi:hypothetical protein
MKLHCDELCHLRLQKISAGYIKDKSVYQHPWNEFLHLRRYENSGNYPAGFAFQIGRFTYDEKIDCNADCVWNYIVGELSY